jgi:hypothetical protein
MVWRAKKTPPKRGAQRTLPKNLCMALDPEERAFTELDGCVASLFFVVLRRAL